MISSADSLLTALDEAYNKKSWHGTNLRGSLRGVSLEEAGWRPQSGRHCIWEIGVHTAYWKYTVRRRLLGQKRGTFALPGSDWFQRPEESTSQAWRKDIALLEEEHRRLRDAVKGLEAAGLNQMLPGAKVTAGFLIRGIIAHDLYHAGQIQLLKKLCRDTGLAGE